MEYNTVSLQQQAAPFDLSSLLGARIGLDTSGRFALSTSGLAIAGSDGKFLALDQQRRRLLDVSSLVLPVGACIYRIPATKVSPGDVIVTSDSPFCALFVLEDKADGTLIQALNPCSSELVSYVPPDNPFSDLLFFADGGSVFVRVVSLFDLLSPLVGEFEEHRR
jgi:hypothetical protein